MGDEGVENRKRIIDLERDVRGYDGNPGLNGEMHTVLQRINTLEENQKSTRGILLGVLITTVFTLIGVIVSVLTNLGGA